MILTKLFLLTICLSVCVIPPAKSKMIRQSPSAVSKPASSLSTVNSLQNILYPALQSLVTAPLKLLQELIREIRVYLQEHNFRELLDLNFLRQSFQRFPQRISTYWHTFTEMEFHCIRRTFCDLSDYTSHRVPAWINQILVIYFSTFSQNNAYYQAVTNGLVTHNCHLVYAECEPKAFLSRLSGNMSQSLATTMEPIRDAINELVHVTAATLDSLGAKPTPASTDLVVPESGSDLSDTDEVDHRIQNAAHDDDDDDAFRLSSNPSDDTSNFVDLREPPMLLRPLTGSFHAMPVTSNHDNVRFQPRPIMRPIDRL